MMEGPRPVANSERASLGQLVDKALMGGAEGAMFRGYPTVFNEENSPNCLVLVDDGRVVTHVGMTQRWASIAGCTVRVACIASVATDEAYRNRGLASQVFAAACEKAFAEGVDFMMISGGRSLYRRAGAVDVGRDFIATIDAGAAASLHARDIRIDEFVEGDLDACAALYDTRVARFVRPCDDWQWLARSRSVMSRDVDMNIVRRRDAACGYFITGRDNREGVTDVLEFAGENTAIAGALKSLLARRSSRAVKMRLQQNDFALKSLLENASVGVTPEKTMGTLLIINFEQLMPRLTPWFEHRIGVAQAKALSFRQEGERFLFSDGGNTVALDRGEAGVAVFGYPEKPLFSGLLAQVFPAPSLYYGINYV